MSGITSKTINDPIHGHMAVPGSVIEIIDTPQFQRLRELKQLGTTNYVYPGATHTRFEHSIGVSHLAGRLMTRFKTTQPELEITDQEVLMTRVAGLCHDLGHGPFSHAFEGWIHRVRPDRPQWKHEDMSELMFQHLIDDNAIDVFDSSEVTNIKRLIKGERGGYAERGWMFDIVSNSRNSIDIDKFDYLTRDAYFTGKKTNFEFGRLMESSKVFNQEIVYKKSEAFELYEMFHMRYSMFKCVYTHRVGKAIEFMIADALALADPHLHISEMVDDPVEFLSLTDSILPTIQFSRDPNLKQAKDVIAKIRTRQLYPMVVSVIISPEKWSLLPARITPEHIVQAGANLREEDILIDQYVLNYGLKNGRNPIDHVKFFTEKSPGVRHIKKEDVSLLIPSQFQEFYIRIFCRDPTKKDLIKQAFWKYLKQFNITEPEEEDEEDEDEKEAEMFRGLRRR